MLNDWLTESTDLDSTDALSRRRHADQPNRRPTQNRTLSPPQNHPPPARSPIVVTRDLSQVPCWLHHLLCTVDRPPGRAVGKERCARFMDTRIAA